MIIFIVAFSAFISLNTAYENLFCSKGESPGPQFEGHQRAKKENSAIYTKSVAKPSAKHGPKCEQPIIHGGTRYGYNKDTQQCEAFVPGPVSSENNFRSLIACQKECVRRPITLSANMDQDIPQKKLPLLQDGIWGDPGERLKPSENSDVEQFLRQRSLNNLFKSIAAVTKWCGPGTKARHRDDLGTAKETDKCCRDHDACPDYIVSGETKYGLTNENDYTRLNCECDSKFRDCLRKSRDGLANLVGTTYFNNIGQMCFKKDYPIVSCKKRGGLMAAKCMQYKLDYSGAKKYQWFHVPNF